MKQADILCLTYGVLTQLTRRAIEKLAGLPIRVRVLEGLGEEEHTQIEGLLGQGVEAVVAGGSNALYAKQNFDVPIIQLRVSNYDYMRAFYQARSHSDRVAVVVAEQDPRMDFSTMAEMLKLSVSVIERGVEEVSYLEACIRDSGAGAVVGGSLAAEVAEHMGLPSVVIYPGVDTVTEAILEANKLIKEMRKERERGALTGALLRFTPNAITILDETGTVIEFNPEAEQAYGRSASSVKGRDVRAAIPESGLEDVLAADGPKRETTVKMVGERMYLAKQILMADEQETLGAIEILTELSDVRQAEYKYNMEREKKNRMKGFNARTRFQDIIGSCQSLGQCVKEAKLFARTDSTLMLLGETGTGKELFAQSIHNESLRKEGPFIAINCAALPENLLESELFGYEEGAFTGSKKGGKMGIFELADQGTIFLDEIGEISPALQARLLRVLQEKEVMRVGGDRLYRIDVRVISATNKNVYALGENEFRRDLLYRLNTLELKLPALRERGADVVELFLHFFRQQVSLSKHQTEVPHSVLNLLREYSWPGNIRELQNVSGRFCVFMNQGGKLDERVLRRYMLRSIGEERLLDDVLHQMGCSGRRFPEDPAQAQAAARRLKELFGYSNEQLSSLMGISRTTLWRMERK